jgi:prenyltransferase beta subunit
MNGHRPANRKSVKPVQSSVTRRTALATFSAWSTAMMPAGLALLSHLQEGRRSDDETERSASSLVTGECQQAIDSGLSYLAGRQNDDGSFGEGLYSRNVAVVSLAAVALLCSGDTAGRGKYGGVIEKAVQFIKEKTAESGFINLEKYQSHGPMYGHGFSTLFLAIVHGSPSIEIKKQLTSAVSVILNSQNDEGGWRYQPRRNEADLSVTVCQVMALRAAKNAGIYVPSEVIDNAVNYVKRCQNPDGGFRYRSDEVESAFARSAAALVALYSAGIYEGVEIERGLKYLIRDFVPSAEMEKSTPHFHYGNYYAIQAMWHAGGKYWSTWYPALRDRLVNTQVKSAGNWDGTISPEYVTAMACISLQIPYNLVPIFQR